MNLHQFTKTHLTTAQKFAINWMKCILPFTSWKFDGEQWKFDGEQCEFLHDFTNILQGASHAFLMRVKPFKSQFLSHFIGYATCGSGTK